VIRHVRGEDRRFHFEGKLEDRSVKKFAFLITFVHRTGKGEGFVDAISYCESVNIVRKLHDLGSDIS
jgi:hypothetical protein